jgi:hypothetical protein
MSRRTLAGLLVFGVGMMLLPATAEASVNVGWSPQTSPGTFDYGTAEIGQRPGKTFHLTNTGSTTTPVLRIKLTGSSAFQKMRDTCSGRQIAPTHSCLVRVYYAPATDGQTDTTVMSANNRTLSATYASITITGTAHGTADLVWTDTATGQPTTGYDFGTAGGTFTATLTNIGTAAAHGAETGASWTPGLISPDKFCASPLFDTDFVAGATCTETWTFDATSCGAYSGSVSGFDSVGSYYVDSTRTTTAGPATLTVTATCP